MVKQNVDTKVNYIPAIADQVRVSVNGVMSVMSVMRSARL